jgi:hypothetical protein
MVDAFFRDVQERCRTCAESGGERDAVVTDVLNGDSPAEATRERNGDVSIVGKYFDVEVRVCTAPGVGAMLFCAIVSTFFLPHNRRFFESDVPPLPEWIQID